MTDDTHDVEADVEAEAAAQVEAELEAGVEPEVPESTIDEPETDVDEQDTDVDEQDTDVDEQDTDVDEQDTDVEEQAPAPIKRSRLRLPRLRRLRRALRMLANSRLVAAILVAVLLISAGAASWIYFKQYRPDQQTDPSVKRAVASSAADGTTALLSYSADTLDQDFASARSHLAGDFLSYYNRFTQQSVGPAAREKSMKTTARVTGAAVSELHPDSAVVLVFVDQTTTTKDAPQPTLVISNVWVTMTRINDNWLITKFNPI